nr:MAG TPA: Gifsy-2 prophage ATP-binding sugar transporter-like barrel, 4 helix bundle.7A [Caudoviricetes sp.]
MSPTFKEMAAKDVGNVFFNNDEFSDMHLIDGKKMHVIIDTNELLDRTQGGSTTHLDGIYKAHILIYVPVVEYGAKPKIGKLLILDAKKTYVITNVIDEDGIYSFELEANRA